MENLKITNFTCDENLRQFKNSMLFDSDTHIAGITVGLKDITVSADLMVRGSVRVRFKGKTYTKPSKLPEEAKVYLARGEYEVFEDEDDDPILYCSENNWFECIYSVTDEDGEEAESDGIMFENCPADFSAEQMKEELLNLIKPVLSDYILGEEASDRMAHYEPGESISQEEMMLSLGISQFDLADIEVVLD